MAFIKRHKKLTIASVIILILVIIMFFLARSVSQAVGDVALGEGVTVVPLDKQDLSDTVTADGKVESRNVVSVSTDLTSKCKQLNVALGDHVEAGDILCVFDTEEIDNQIATLEASSSSAAALAKKQTEIANRNVESAKSSQSAQLAEQQTKINAVQASINAKNTELSTLEEGTDEYNLIASEIGELSAELAQENAAYNALVTSTNEAIQSAQDNLDTTSLSDNADAEVAQTLTKLYRQRDEATVVAEQSGTITALNIAQGGIANGSLMTISDPNALQVSVSVREKDILKMSEGMTARITADALGDATLGGTVVRVINFTSADTSTGSSEIYGGDSQGTSSGGYSADVSVNEPGDLLLGMSVKVEIVVSEAGEKQAAPFDSIIEEGEDSYVLVAKENGEAYKLDKVKVTTGASNDYYVEVASDELKQGDLIVVDPAGYEDGDEVELVDVVEEITESLEEEE